MRAILDKILWGSLLLFFGPSIMIVASWNALPGDALYGTKLALERTALTITSPSYAAAGTLQIKYTERRYAEAKQLLASKQSIQGLPYLQQQIAETKKAIERAPNKEAQVTLAKQYINTLQTVATELEEQKTAITTSPQPVAYVPPPTQQQPTNRSASSPTPSPRPTSDVKEVPTSSPSPTQMAQVVTTMPIPTQHAVVALQIDQTQQNVNQTIADLQELVGDDDHRGKREEQRNKPKQKDDDKKEMKEDRDRRDESKKNE